LKVQSSTLNLLKLVHSQVSTVVCHWHNWSFVFNHWVW